MKIIRVELTNHMVIPELVELDLNNVSDVICINGYNGSGKSFLINSLHPYGNNKRSDKAYTIKNGKSGSKRIIYELDNGDLFEVFHEYTPNKKSHSCKSYCFITEQGKERVELNPTGHVPNFKDIVKKYLNFTNETFTCAFLSPSILNIVSATQKERLNILENTNNSSEILKKYQKNVAKEVSELNSFTKAYNAQQNDLLRRHNFQNIDSIKDRRMLITTELDIKNKHKIRLTNELKNITNTSSDFDTLNKETLRLDAIRTALEFAFSEFNNLEEVYNKYKLIHEDFIKTDLLITSIDKDIDTNENKLQSLRTMQDNIEVFEEYKREYEELKTITDKHADLKDDFVNTNVYDTVEKIIEILSEFSTDPPLKQTRLYIHETKEDIKKYREFINDYEYKLEQIPDSSLGINIDIRDNCNSCYHFNESEKIKVFIKNKASKYEKYKKELIALEELLEELEFLKPREDELDRLRNSMTHNTHSFLGILNVHTMILKRSTIIKELKSKLPLLTKIRYSFNRIGIVAEHLKNLKNTISNTNEFNETDILNIITELKNRKSSIIEFHKSNTDFINEYNKYSNVIYMDDYSKMNVQELTSLIDEKCLTIKDITSSLVRKQRFTEQLEEINNSIIELEKEISVISSTIEVYDETHKSIIGFTNNLQDFKILREVLEKQAPIYLMSNTISYIENLTNEIMEEVGINLSIEVILEGDQIRIPVFTKTSEVEDISSVSTGEMCLLATTIHSILLTIIGYKVLCLDEIDANLDVVYRDKFQVLIDTIFTKLNISQIICISHNIANELNASHVILGEFNANKLQGNIIKRY